MHNLYSSNGKRSYKNSQKWKRNYKKYFLKFYISLITTFMIADTWQAHYQILSIIFLKKFIELNVNLATMIKNEKHLELNISIATVFLNSKILKLIQKNANLCVFNKNYQHKFD